MTVRSVLLLSGKELDDYKDFLTKKEEVLFQATLDGKEQAVFNRVFEWAILAFIVGLFVGWATSFIAGLVS